jgi:hypothetical protein
VPPRSKASVFAPGRNCWRIERAKRVAFLVDGEEYFGAVRKALAKAQRSFFVLGWDIHSQMRLTPGGANDGLPEPLADFLNAIVGSRRGLRGCRSSISIGAHIGGWHFVSMISIRSARRIIRRSSSSTTRWPSSAVTT